MASNIKKGNAIWKLFTVLDATMDISPNLIQNHPKCNDTLKNMILDIELKDIWRLLNQYT